MQASYQITLGKPLITGQNMSHKQRQIVILSDFILKSHVDYHLSRITVIVCTAFPTVSMWS